MTTKAIRGALVLGEDGFEADAAVLVEGDAIAGVVDAAAVPEGAERVDWGDVAIVPGTVNAHGHAFQNLLKGWADDRPFDSWRDDVLYPFSEGLSGDDVYTGALFAFTEALRAGVTTTVDFFYLHDGGNGNAERVIGAARDAGIRLVLARALYDVDAPTKAPARYREKTGEAVERCRSLAAAHAGDPMVSVQPAPHSLHAASPETVAAALEVAEELDVPCHLHLAEARYEREQVEERYGTTPVRLLAREGLLGPRLVTIHTVWADDEELDLLAGAGAAVVHCPGANAFLGDGIARLPEMLARGIRVALGPDGGCANNRQSVFEEMRQATLMAKARLTDGSAVTAETAFDLGTKGGARVLGLPVGAIEPGRRADLVGLDLGDPSLWPLATLRKQVVASLQQTAVDKVMVGGRLVVDGGRPVSVDEAALRRAVESVSARWAKR
ncbi:MAG TPA: amidohydrolase [Actinomycetota bacterium]|nr:amidohydrolase [Actinomycetota bacterium]